MSYIGGLYTGLEYVGALVNNSEQVANLDSYLNSLVSANKQDSVVSIFMMPTKFYTTSSMPVVEVMAVERPTKLAGGYTPRNNKLLTYPYSFLTIDCVNDSKNYKFELSKINNGSRINFAITCGMSPNVEIVCCPIHYNGAGEDELNYTEELVMTGFPQCAFTIDAFRAWLAQKSVGDILGLTATAMGAGAAFATGNIHTGAMLSIGAAQQINSTVIEATKGSTARGTQGSSTLTATRGKNFYVKFMSVTINYARMIDDFFDRYGYAIDRITAPNRSSRPHWNYIQTRDCSITGSVPVDDMRKICSIYDKGVTFWKKGSEVGNYSLDNRPT